MVVDILAIVLVYQQPLPQGEDCRGTSRGSITTRTTLITMQVLFYASLSWGGRRSLLSLTLNSHQMALKYLVSALTHFYIGLLSPTTFRLIQS